jgi:hypothetical protein
VGRHEDFTLYRLSIKSEGMGQLSAIVQCVVLLQAHP